MKKISIFAAIGLLALSSGAFAGFKIARGSGNPDFTLESLEYYLGLPGQEILVRPHSNPKAHSGTVTFEFHKNDPDGTMRISVNDFEGEKIVSLYMFDPANGEIQGTWGSRKDPNSVERILAAMSTGIGAAQKIEVQKTIPITDLAKKVEERIEKLKTPKPAGHERPRLPM